MIGALIIVFREVIEAGLIIGIVLAATQHMAGSRLWVTGGVAGGVAGSIVVAVFMGAIASAFGGSGQELFNAAVLFTAVIMLIWHNVWMAGHGRKLASDLFSAGRAVVEGRKPLAALAIVVGAAVLREGSEVALFLYGIAVTSGAGNLILGGALGLALGAAVSALTYFGLLRIPTRQLFFVTGLLIALLAAGMAAQAIGLLQQAGTISMLDSTVWDSSFLLSEKSAVGLILHTLVGYTERPSGLQLVAYGLTLAATYVLTKLARARSSEKEQAIHSPAE